MKHLKKLEDFKYYNKKFSKLNDIKNSLISKLIDDITKKYNELTEALDKDDFIFYYEDDDKDIFENFYSINLSNNEWDYDILRQMIITNGNIYLYDKHDHEYNVYDTNEYALMDILEYLENITIQQIKDFDVKQEAKKFGL